jgi:hypothetical protein
MQKRQGQNPLPPLFLDFVFPLVVVSQAYFLLFFLGSYLRFFKLAQK